MDKLFPILAETYLEYIDKIQENKELKGQLKNIHGLRDIYYTFKYIA
jgi:hypothetical protein